MASAINEVWANGVLVEQTFVSVSLEHFLNLADIDLLFSMSDTYVPELDSGELTIVVSTIARNIARMFDHVPAVTE